MSFTSEGITSQSSTLCRRPRMMTFGKPSVDTISPESDSSLMSPTLAINTQDLPNAPQSLTTSFPKGPEARSLSSPVSSPDVSPITPRKAECLVSDGKHEDVSNNSDPETLDATCSNPSVASNRCSIKWKGVVLLFIVLSLLVTIIALVATLYPYKKT